MLITENQVQTWIIKNNIKKLIKALDCDDCDDCDDDDLNKIQKLASDALIKIGKPVVKPLLHICDKKYNYRIKNESGPFVLSQIYKTTKDEEVFNTIINALKPTSKGWKANSAARALSLIGDMRAEIPLIDGLINKYGGIKDSFIVALGKLKSEKAVLPLINILDHEMNFEPADTIEALITIGKPAIEHLLQSMLSKNINVSHACIKILRKLENKMDKAQKKIFKDFTEINKEDIQRGGFGEPYCSEKCFKKAGEFIIAILNNKSIGVCGFCNKKMKISDYDSMSFGYIPYEGKILYICTECSSQATDMLIKYDHCCMCQKQLTI